MKSSIVLLCMVLALALGDWAPRTHDQYNQDREECFQELKLSEETIENIKKRQYLDDPNAVCYARCMSIKSETWNDSEGFNLDRIYETFTQAGMKVSKDNLAKCLGRIMDVSTCQWATINMRCLFDNKSVSRK